MESISPVDNGRKIRVCVGMSGGVDSSVTAALLKQQGFEVIGVYMKNWNTASPTLGDRPLDPEQYRMECPWYDDYLDAKRVALQLGIEFHMWDFREAYKQKVFDYFITETEKGRTPNPDVYCNSLVKFDDFQKRAVEELGADYVATGHYARLQQESGVFHLQIPADGHKDQTYFLYRLSQAQLSKALFPLADLPKEQVRKLAIALDLPNKYKKDSQGICFIGEVDVREFVAQWLAPKEGEVRDLEGRVIGRHDGIHLYTIGERVPVDNRLVAQAYPELKQDIPGFYVAAKDVNENVLVAVPGPEHEALYKHEATIEDVIMVDSKLAANGLQARLRHGGKLVPVASVIVFDDRATVTFDAPQRAVAPGQHLVLYDAENRVVGGGVIS